MSFVLNSALESAFSVLWGQARSLCGISTEHLKEGDVATERFRQLMVRELEEIKSSLDAIVRRDLHSSVSFLKEGVALFKKICPDTSSRSGYYQGLTSGQTQPGHLPGMATDRFQHPSSSTLNEAWIYSQAADESDMHTKKRLEEAKKCFKTGRKEATRAFNNAALGTEERILATKLRITCRIMESIADPDTAGEACKSYIQELHGLPAIQKIFSVHFNGGVKAYMMRGTRLRHVVSVIEINRAVHQFIKRFCTGEGNGGDWPKITLACGEFDPICCRDSRIEEALEHGFTKSSSSWFGSRVTGMLRQSKSSEFV